MPPKMLIQPQQLQQRHCNKHCSAAPRPAQNRFSSRPTPSPAALRPTVAPAAARRSILLSSPVLPRMAATAAAAAAASAGAPTSHDLLVVGPGVLGSFLGKLWKEAYPSSSVVGLTNTTNNHAR